MKFDIDGQEFDIDADFTKGKIKQRLLRAQKNNEPIAKACGVKPDKQLHIVDCTAGLGLDGMILAASGAKMTLIERHSQVHTLLEQGLLNAALDEDLQIICGNIQLIHQDAIKYLSDLTTSLPDVIYLDPMYPEKKKSALSRKEMQVLQSIVGKDVDTDKVFELACQKAKRRVVVKRPRLAPTLADKKPDFSQSYQSARFDIYMCNLS